MAIVPRCDLAELLELVEAALDEIAFFVLPRAVVDVVASD